jgi:dipeptidyl aminopeptidase/acylaminoacyl peptidase
MIRSTHDGRVTLKQGAKFVEQLKYLGWTFEI